MKTAAVKQVSGTANPHTHGFDPSLCLSGALGMLLSRTAPTMVPAAMPEVAPNTTAKTTTPNHAPDKVEARRAKPPSSPWCLW